MEHKKKIQHDEVRKFLENFSTLTYKNNPWEVRKTGMTHSMPYLIHFPNRRLPECQMRR